MVKTIRRANIGPVTMIMFARYAASLGFCPEYRCERFFLARHQCREHLGTVGCKPAEGQLVIRGESDGAVVKGEVSGWIVCRVIHQNQMCDPFGVMVQPLYSRPQSCVVIIGENIAVNDCECL